MTVCEEKSPKALFTLNGKFAIIPLAILEKRRKIIGLNCILPYFAPDVNIQYNMSDMCP